MTLKEILQTGGNALLILTILIQIAPIKINPWSALASWIGHAINKDIIERINENDVKNVRYRIIRFNDEIRHNTCHTEEHFNQILDDIKMYEDYCRAHPDFQNEKMRHSVANIRKIYEKCFNENSFL